MPKVFEPRKSQVQGIIFRFAPQLEFLILKRNAEKGGFWQPITGGVKLDEEPRQTISREVKEEIGLMITDQAIIDLHYHFFFDADEHTRFREDVFAVELAPDQEVTLSSEHTAFQWLPFEQAQKQIYWESNKKTLELCQQFLLTYISIYDKSKKS